MGPPDDFTLAIYSQESLHKACYMKSCQPIVNGVGRSQAREIFARISRDGFGHFVETERNCW